MRTTYPTARFLSIAASGEFTGPAKDLIRSKDIELFYVPKRSIVEAFVRQGLSMDYPDNSAETFKAQIANSFEEQLTKEKKEKVADTLFDIIGRASVDAYTSKVRGFLSSLPQEVRFVEGYHSDAAVFESVEEATDFLDSPSFKFSGNPTDYRYEVTYSDGQEFSREVADLLELKALHGQLVRLSRHMEDLARGNV